MKGPIRKRETRTVTFQPSPVADAILERLREAGFRASEKINEAIEAHVPALLKELERRAAISGALSGSEVPKAVESAVAKVSADVRKRKAGR